MSPSTVASIAGVGVSLEYEAARLNEALKAPEGSPEADATGRSYRDAQTATATALSRVSLGDVQHARGGLSRLAAPPPAPPPPRGPVAPQHPHGGNPR